MEEVNIIKGGPNYGWAKRKGTFVYLQTGGTGLGVGATQLPVGDDTFVYTCPNVQVQHSAKRGYRFVGTAMARSCSIENGLQLSGVLIYATFLRLESCTTHLSMT